MQIDYYSVNVAYICEANLGSFIFFSIRIVLHHQISASDVQYTVSCFQVNYITLISDFFCLLAKIDVSFMLMLQKALTGAPDENGH